ncbi:MAG: FAD-binding oxidoreductase [Oceanospirillaceae bacterium]
MNTDVVIIGGGIQGCASAYYLAKAGVTVTVLEKDWVSRHASGVNAGGVRSLGRHINEVPLSLASIELWQTLSDELNTDTGFRRKTLINIAADEADMQTLRAREREMHALGYYHEHILDEKTLRKHLPHVAGHCVGGVLSNTDGYAIPYQTTTAYKRAAAALGVKFVEGEAVQQIRKVGNTWLIASDKHKYQSRHIVNCAGAWADKIAVMIGDNVPMSYSAPMLMITTRLPHFVTPVVGAVSRPLSLKQFENGTVLIGGGAKGFADREQNRSRLDYKKLSVGAGTAAEFFPMMAKASVNRMWAGLEAYMPDNLPVIGPSLAAENAFHAFGFSAHGFQMGPIVGKIISQLISEGSSTFDLSPFRVDRFDRKVL